MANLVPLSNSSLIKSNKTSIVKADKLLRSNSKIVKVQKKATDNKKIFENPLLKIERQVIQIDNILKGMLSLQRKQTEKKRIKKEEQSFDKKEKELETKRPKIDSKLSLPTPPKLGFFGWIKNFITNTILGFFAVRLIDFLPQLLKILPVIIKVGDFFIDVGGKMLDGLITFVDWGYKAVDGTRQFVKQLGGDSWAKNFDTFAGAIDNVIEIAVIAALATADSAGDGGFGGGGGGGRPGRQPLYNNRGFRGNQGFTLQGERALNPSRGRNFANAHQDIMKRYFQRFGRDKFIQRFGQEGLEALPGGMARSGLAKFGRRAFMGLAGKSGAKAVLGFVRPLLKRIPLPVIGVLVDFGLSVALGENPGRAAFKAIGAGLLGAVGTAIGSLAFGFGGIVGGILGSIGGDAIGGALYDMFFGNKKPQPKGKTTKAAGGGPATRSGKPVAGTSKRTLSKKKKPRTLRATPTKLRPGSSIGGEDKIKKLYPEPEQKDKNKKVDSFGFLKKSYDTFSQDTGFNQLVALAIKPLMGDKPGFVDYKNAAAGINNWMNSILSTGTLGYAEGGQVKLENIVSGEDYSNVIAKSLQDSVAPQSDKIINDLMKQLGLKEMEGVGKDKTPGAAPGAEGPGGLAGQYSPQGIQGDIYKYLISKGMDDIHALGLMANISRESGFRPAVLGDDKTSGGLFQWHEGRFANMQKKLSNWQSDWKAQVDYALSEPGEPGQQYLNKKFNSSQEAADWWMRNWERPAEYIQTTEGPQVHKQYLASVEKYKTQKGYNIPTSADLGNMPGGVQYITGDPNNPNYSPDHGGGNYHDHLGFKDRATAERAYNFFKSRFTVTEFKGYSALTGKKHNTPGDPHYQGVAFDIPGIQWGGTGAIGSKEYAGSAKVRTALKEFLSTKAMFRGGLIKKRTNITLAEKGPEFVLDFDTTINSPPGFLEALNKASTKQGVLNVIQKYASYNTPYSEPEIVFIPIPSPSTSSVPSSTQKPFFTVEGGIDNSIAEQMKDTLMYG